MARTENLIKATEFETAKQDQYNDMSSSWLNPWNLTEEIVVGSGDTTEDLSVDIPARTVVTGVTIQSIDGVTIATGTHVALGISGGDIDAFCEIAVSGNLDTAFDQYTEMASAAGGVYVATASTPAITCTNGSGSQAGTFSGSFRIIIHGFRVPLIENVA